jgi:N-acetylneuraminate synthase
VGNFHIIDVVRGREEKTVLPCEAIPRREARRSLVLTRALKQGEQIKQADVTAKRPGTGIPPGFAEIIIGRSVKMSLPEDTVLSWDMI